MADYANLWITRNVFAGSPRRPLWEGRIICFENKFIFGDSR